MNGFECVRGVVVEKAYLLVEGKDPVDFGTVRLKCFERPSGVRCFWMMESKFEFGRTDIVRQLSCVKLCHPFEGFFVFVHAFRNDSYGFQKMVHVCIFFL